MSITGAPGEGRIRVGIPVADLTAGLFCATGISRHCCTARFRANANTGLRTEVNCSKAAEGQIRPALDGPRTD
jgi:hypothetical protein